MSALTTVVIAFILALLIATIGWAGPAVVFAIPIAIVGIGLALFSDFRKRRKSSEVLQDQRQRAKTDDVDFTERDRDTLYSN